MRQDCGISWLHWCTGIQRNLGHDLAKAISRLKNIHFPFSPNVWRYVLCKPDLVTCTAVTSTECLIDLEGRFNLKLLGRRCPFVSSANTSRRIGFPDRSHISSQSGHISFAILAKIRFSSWGHISSLRSDLPSHVAILIPQPSSLLQAMREGIFLLLNALKPNA